MNDEIEVTASEIFYVYKDYGPQVAVFADTWEDLPDYHKDIYRGVAESVVNNRLMSLKDFLETVRSKPAATGGSTET
ncbi:MAG: hypothetical protein MN733_05480 [Nitrososphaera sp.]|nr:hypothetical protein [Nitrososphaera sp.]